LQLMACFCMYLHSVCVTATTGSVSTSKMFPICSVNIV
jgi:hypothetical protein